MRPRRSSTRAAEAARTAPSHPGSPRTEAERAAQRERGRQEEARSRQRTRLTTAQEIARSHLTPLDRLDAPPDLDRYLDRQRGRYVRAAEELANYPDPAVRARGLQLLGEWSGLKKPATSIGPGASFNWNLLLADLPQLDRMTTAELEGAIEAGTIAANAPLPDGSAATTLDVSPAREPAPDAALRVPIPSPQPNAASRNRSTALPAADQPTPAGAPRPGEAPTGGAPRPPRSP